MKPTSGANGIVPPGGLDAASRLKRILLAGSAFALYEALFIWLLGDRIYDFTYFSFGMMSLIVSAGAGYFALGFLSRSWLSGFFLLLPVLVAVFFVHDVWAVEYGNGGSTVSVIENANFVEIWLTLSAVFVPAWALGILTATTAWRGSATSRRSSL